LLVAAEFTVQLSTCAKTEYRLTVNLFQTYDYAVHFTEEESVQLNYCIVANSNATTFNFKNFSSVFQDRSFSGTFYGPSNF